MTAVIIVFIVLVAVFPLVLVSADSCLPLQYDLTYYAQLSDMYDKLENTEGKKIVIIGGSSVAFGVQSAAIEGELRANGQEYTVCNFGLYGALGTKVMLDLALTQLHAGDVAVLAIEPDEQMNSLFFGAESMWKCMEGDRGLFFSVAAEDRSALVGGYMQFLQERFQYYRTGAKPRPTDVYAKSSFNENGDMVYERSGNAMAYGYDPADPIELSEAYISDEFIDYVNLFIKEAGQKGAAVCMSFAPMNEQAVSDLADQSVYEWFQFLNRSFNCELISDPWDYILESGWFYDNNYHLNSAGAVLHSKNLTEDLLHHLGCSAAVQWELPEMPESIYQGEKPGQGEGQADVDCFLYEEVYGTDGQLIGVNIPSLTNAGRVKERLAIPSAYSGLPVLSFSAEVFAGNTVIKEVIIPSSIVSMLDYSFAGCNNLQIVRLLHTAAPPSVGEHPFDGEGGGQISSLIIQVTDIEIYRSAGCMDYWKKYLPFMEEI